MEEKTNNSTTNGELTYEDKVIQKIISLALESVDGLLSISGGFLSNIADKLVNTDNVTAGINVEVGKTQVAVDLDIVAEYGKNVVKIYNEMKELVAKEVKKMTGLEVVEVNVNVVDVKTREQHQKDSISAQDKISEIAGNTSDFVAKQTGKAKKSFTKDEKDKSRVK